MALTHQLAQRGTPVREFFEARFPASAFKRLSKEWYEQVRAATVICVPPAGISPGTIGTAFDYRCRLCWAPIEWNRTVAAGGMMNVFALGHVELGMLAMKLHAELEAIAPTSQRGDLDQSAEDRLSCGRIR